MAERDEIDRVRSSVNIVDIVSPYVALKRSGPIWKGCCPFHSEKTPSFQVNPDKGFWYCFGQCSEGGDAFDFLMKAENLQFGEALERLAQKAGITLTRGHSDSQETTSKRDKLYRALEVATKYYQETLASNPTAMQYLLDRGIAYESIKSFRLGFAGDGWDGLAGYFRRNKVELADAVEAGILTKGDRSYGEPYDKLRGRIVCPILDVHDRPIAFGGRLIEAAEGRPKYLNTAETPLFFKGKTFFAMSRARKAIAEKGIAIVVEGYFDVISAHQAGFLNVVATLGTSLTPDHAEILGRHAQRVILAFDADAAGLKAAQRANAILEAKEFEALVLNLPQGEDPDSLLRAGKLAEFTTAIDDAMPIREFQLRTLLTEHEKKTGLTERDKAAIFRREITPLIKLTKSVIERERYIRMAAPMHPFFDQGSAMAEDQIRQEITGTPPGGQIGQPQYGGFGYSGGGRFGDKRRPPAPKPENATGHAPAKSLQVAEENILKAMISGDDALDMLVAESVTAEMFVSPLHKELASRLLSGTFSSRSAIIDELYGNNEVGNLLARLMVSSDNAVGENQPSASSVGTNYAPLTESIVEDSIKRLAREQSARVEDELRTRAEGGDVAAAQELMRFIREQHGSK